MTPTATTEFAKASTSTRRDSTSEEVKPIRVVVIGGGFAAVQFA